MGPCVIILRYCSAPRRGKVDLGELNMPQGQFHKGDRVRFRLGTRSVHGIVKEDRGPIGINGRRLYLVEFRAEPQSPSQIELPADQLEAVTGAGAAKKGIPSFSSRKSFYPPCGSPPAGSLP